MIVFGARGGAPVDVTGVSGIVTGGVGEDFAMVAGETARGGTDDVAFAVDDRLKFGAGPVRSSALEPESSNRTPMGFAALKTKPKAVPRPRIAANCKAIRRESGMRAMAGAEAGEVAGDTGCADTGAGPDCCFWFLRPLPMHAESNTRPSKGQ